MGLPEAIAYVISQMPTEVQGMFWAHIGIFGGLGMVANLGERLSVLPVMSKLPERWYQKAALNDPGNGTLGLSVLPSTRLAYSKPSSEVQFFSLSELSVYQCTAYAA